MEEIIITRGTTRAIINIDLEHPVAPEIRSITKELLTDYEWDPVTRRLKTVKSFTTYSQDTKELFLPINGLDAILSMMDALNVKYKIIDEEPYKERDIKLELIPDFKPRDAQVDIIEYLSADLPNRKGLATATGSGKTVSTIASVVEFGKVAVIIVSGLCDQWVRQFQHFTNVESKIYLVQGFPSLVALLESDYKPDVLIFSLETLRLYLGRLNKYSSLPTFNEILNYYGVGVKVMDEVHLNFHTQTQIDLNANVRNNIYLSATFDATNKYTKKVLDLIYPSDMRYGEHSFKKYIDVVCYMYHGEVPEKYCIRQRGYIHTNYERTLLKSKFAIRRYFDQILHRIVEEHYIVKRTPGDKMAIYFARTNMVAYATKWFKQQYPDLNVISYVSGVKDDVLDDTDIIVTTPKKCGTGSDIKNLIFVFNTVSFKTPITTKQLMGRLRELKGKPTVYAELVDVKIQAQIRHMVVRSGLHKRIAKSYRTEHVS